jgi:glucose-1-phosphate adenylyltransferase
VLLTEGCRIRRAEISDSIMGLRAQVAEGAHIKSSIIMGGDHYEVDGQPDIPIGIGPGCQIEGAIVDKNARIGANVVIRPFPKGHPDVDTENWLVRDGIVVVPKDGIIPPDTHIGPNGS